MQSTKSNTRLIGTVAIAFALCWICSILMISDAYYIDRQVYAVESPYSAFNVPPAYDSKLYRGISTTSLQLPINPADNSTMTEILGQTLLAMQNLQLVVTASGGFMKNILKCTIVLHDIALFEQMATIYQLYFEEESRPAVTLISSDLPKIGDIQALVAIEAYVAIPPS